MTEKDLAEDYRMVLHEAESMGCNEIKALYNIPLKNMEMIVQALEKQIPEKPIWHDLRKDPKDLPKDNDARSEYMVTDGNQYFISKYFGNGAFVNGCWEYPYGVFECNSYDVDVIAWREIEPFEGVEE